MSVRGDLDVEIDMVPVMNMFLVLIPFLLMSSGFLHLKAINTSVPVKSETENVLQNLNEKPDIKVTAILELGVDRVKIYGVSNELTEKQLDKFDARVKLGKTGKSTDEMIQLSQKIQVLLEAYPKSDTVIIVPAPDVVYDSIVMAMDASRSFKGKKLFPNVVISNSVR